MHKELGKRELKTSIFSVNVHCLVTTEPLRWGYILESLIRKKIEMKQKEGKEEEIKEMKY